jgi:hypothetical protein
VAKFFRKIDVSRFCISKQNFFETRRIFRSAEPNKSAALSFVVEAFAANAATTSLPSRSPEKQSIQQQQDHCADDRHNPAGDIITARKDATDPRANQGAGDPEQNRDDATTGIFSRHQQLCDRTDNKTNEYGPND